MRAKLVKILDKPKDQRFFKRYVYECIDCSRRYIRGQCNDRILPYCWECEKKHNKQKAEERKRQKEKALKNAEFIKVQGCIEHTRNARMNKKESLNYIDKYIDYLMKGEMEC